MTVHRRRGWSRAFAVLLVGALALIPDMTASAGPTQHDDPGSRRQGGSASSAQVSLDVDVQTAAEADVEQAIGDIRENIQSQLVVLDAAQEDLRIAEQAVLVAQGAVEETEREIDELVARSDEVVIEAFVNPPAASAIDVLSTTSVEDAALKHALLDMQAVEDAEVLAELHERQEELEKRRAEEREARAEADARRAEAEAALDDLQAAVDQRTAFLLEVERRLERALAEAESLEAIDPELAEELRAQHSALAERIDSLREEIQTEAALEAAGVAPASDSFVDGPSVIQPAPGGLVSVSCPAGGSIQVAGAIARNVQSLLNLSAQQGLSMCGTGYRDPQHQISLRRRNCGSSNYAIYQAPASACSPPTARPGQSLHERGLAVDFTCGGSTVRSGDPCYRFLQNNAGTYDLYNLPGEPWHWSNDGT
jgi:peptidoglycan hydrolase CwlO-like protein